MPFYRDEHGGIHYLSDASFEHLLPGGCVEIPDADAEQSAIPIAIPSQITARQLRLWLAGAGLLDQIDAALAAIPDDMARTTAQIEWEYATSFERSHALIASIGTAIGLDDAQIDAAFVAAAQL